MNCADHQDMEADKRLGYLEWHDKAAEANRRGIRQRRCSECKRWFFPWEMRGARAADDQRILPGEHFRDVARAMLRHAFAEYMRWQTDGDWDTFLSWVKDERPRVSGA